MGKVLYSVTRCRESRSSTTSPGASMIDKQAGDTVTVQLHERVDD
jgi:hypothetical protein